MLERVTDDALEQSYLDDERIAPWLFANMVTTIDGATAIDGRSSSIGDEQDLIVFRALRACADAIVVAAETARAEGYRKPRLPKHLREWRRAQGRSELPRIAIVSSSLEFDLEPFGDDPPVVLTTEASPRDRRNRLEALTDVIVCGDERVDLTTAVASLHAEGFGRLLSEGGPSLNGQLATADLVDEWCITVAPLVVSGDSNRIVSGGSIADGGHQFRLDRALAGRSSLFIRWVRGPRT